MKHCVCCKKRLLRKRVIYYGGVRIPYICKKCYEKHKWNIFDKISKFNNALDDIYWQMLLYGKCLWKMKDDGNIEIVDENGMRKM